MSFILVGTRIFLSNCSNLQYNEPENATLSLIPSKFKKATFEGLECFN
jgi:hypothetical protein